MIYVRAAGLSDARALADLLNPIITTGGTTALTEHVDADTIQSWMRRGGTDAIWHLCEDEGGDVYGFQWVEPHPDLPAEAADIATFVKQGQTGLGVGTKLFNATTDAARAKGYKWINARIRADNSGGLIYYQSRGFETYSHIKGAQLANGTVVDKVSKRFDL